MTRARSDVVTFQHPFMLNGLDESQPAGAYAIEIEEEALPTLLHPAYRQRMVWLTLPARAGAGTTQIIPISPADLAAALARDSAAGQLQASAVSTQSRNETRRDDAETTQQRPAGPGQG